MKPIAPHAALGAFAAVLLLGAGGHARAQTAAPAAPQPAWKKVFGNNQYDVYMDMGSGHPGEAQPGHPTPLVMIAVVQYAVAEVVNNTQVSSTQYRVQFDCKTPALAAIDITQFAGDMGAGAVVTVTSANDAWHLPQAGTLDETLWINACGRPLPKAP